MRRRAAAWRDLAVLCGAAAVLWLAHAFGWIDGLPWQGLVALTGFWLAVGFVRFYLDRKGIELLEQDFRADRWEKAAQMAIMACLAVAFPSVLLALSQAPSGSGGVSAWAARLGTTATFAAASVVFLLMIYSICRRWRTRRR